MIEGLGLEYTLYDKLVNHRFTDVAFAVARIFYIMNSVVLSHLEVAMTKNKTLDISGNFSKSFNHRTEPTTYTLACFLDILKE